MTAHETWYAAAAGYLGMWMAMMVPMMLPSLVPMLSWYRRSLRDVEGIQLHGLTVVLAGGYFAVWALIGAMVHATGAGLMTAELQSGAVAGWLPAVAGWVLVLAGGVQLTPWKARQLMLCREEPGGCRLPSTAVGAWGYGLRLGVRCSLCCGSLMLALLAVGMMNLVAMAAAALAISAERLAPAPLQVARAAGVGLLVLGVLTLVRL